jgi:chromosomal replication initiator protein
MIPQPRPAYFAAPVIDYPFSGIIPNMRIDRQGPALTPLTITQAAAKVFDINLKNIYARSRRRDCTEPRQISMYLMRTILGMRVMEIGDLFKMNHTTVTHATQHVGDLMETDPVFQQQVENIIEEIMK